MASPERSGRHRRRELGIFDDRFLPGLARLVSAIRAAGTKTSIQLGHAGWRYPPGHLWRAADRAFGNSSPGGGGGKRDQHARGDEPGAHCAERARAAGFDCVEIHVAHGDLISQFHTPFENRRADAYGGRLENRARFGLELTRRVKAAVAKLGVIYRLSVDDFFREGLREEEGLSIATWAARHGADAAHVAAGHYRSLPNAAGMIPPMVRPDATFFKFARAVKPRLSIPVIAVGRLGEPAIAQAALADAACDFIALGRPWLADPDWSRKARAGVPVRACRRCRPRRPRRGAPGQHQTHGLDAVGRSAIARPSQALCPEGSLVLAAQ